MGGSRRFQPAYIHSFHEESESEVQHAQFLQGNLKFLISILKKMMFKPDQGVKPLKLVIVCSLFEMNFSALHDIWTLSSSRVPLPSGTVSDLNRAGMWEKKDINGWGENNDWFNPLIGFKHICFENLKWNFAGFPSGFDYFEPRIRIPREKLYIYI